VERRLVLGIERQRRLVARLGPRFEEAGVALAAGQVGVPHRHRVGPHDLGLEVAGADRHADAEHPAPWPGHVDVDGQAFDRHGPHQLERQPGQAEAVARPPLDRPRDERGDRATVLMAGVPRAPGVPGRDEVGAAGLVQRLDGHPLSLPDGRSGRNGRAVSRPASRPP
jgi:hypothetical protein